MAHVMALKHILHCIIFITVILVVVSNGVSRKVNIDPIKSYGFFITIIIYALKLLRLATLPNETLNFCGLIFFNAFPGAVKLKKLPSQAPFVCVRIVTRGTYPKLVLKNVKKNLEICEKVGLENFVIEVVTDEAIGVPVHDKVREIVVPLNYETKNGTRYKARALNYCWEKGINKLSDSDWIVHLDEETLMTEDSVKGILNFIFDDKHEFGQGLITYANQEIINWVTTLVDTYRVAGDMGIYRLQFLVFHRPVFGIKGSFLVVKAGAEKSVSFDNGPEGSISEDCFLALKAWNKGYTFNFIEGEMWEMSPFSILDLLRQRKRWFEGVGLIINSRELPFKYIAMLWILFYSTLFSPIIIGSIFLDSAYPVPFPFILDVFNNFMFAVNIYMPVYGGLKSFSWERFGYYKIVLTIATAILLPLNTILVVTYVLWAVLGKKYNTFYVVEKNVNFDKSKEI